LGIHDEKNDELTGSRRRGIAVIGLAGS